MVRIHQKMKTGNYKSKMILQVHDELIFEVVPNELDLLREMVIHEMTNAVKLDIPLRVDWGVGKNWLEAH